MSTSDSSPIASRLHQSIEQLVEETVQRTRVSHEEEKTALLAAMQTALGEIESGQAAFNRAADALRATLGSAAAPPVETDLIDEPIVVAPVVAISESAAPSVAVSETSAAPVTDESGPHELDVIAHDVTITIASGLQSWLRGRDEVKSAQTREFVNGELRLNVDMLNSLDLNALASWLTDSGGRIITHTPKVIEIRFGN